MGAKSDFFELPYIKITKYNLRKQSNQKLKNKSELTLKSNSFWHSLVAVMTLTLFLITAQFSIPSNPAWADQTGNCYSDKLGHTECTNIDKTNNGTIIIVNQSDSGKAEAFVAGVIVGAIGGSASTIAAVSTAGSVAGLGAAGVTSGLAAIGSIAGGGMVAGLAVSAAVPVITASVVGYVAYKAWEWVHPPQTQNVEITPH
ncbi:hypothetical protein QUB68_29305 [Microcoleus sp. A006_D1]|uniref:hypothetical protein n=1 Tax=Microcoleus sp. A006_D1 TaxID=3055267 RepID=UPI002FD5F3CD